MSITFKEAFKEFSQEGTQKDLISGRYRYKDYSHYLCLSFKHWCQHKGYPAFVLQAILREHLKQRFPGFEPKSSLEVYFYNLLFGRSGEKTEQTEGLMEQLANIARVHVMKDFLENDNG